MNFALPSAQSADKRVGSAQQKRRYDLPLHEDAGTAYVITLVALMAFLSVVILSFSFSLTHMMRGWSEGLEHKVTIKIPVKDMNETARSDDTLLELRQRLQSKLSQASAVRTIKALEPAKMQSLIHEWLGESHFVKDLPLPVLISVELQEQTANTKAALEKIIHSIDPAAQIETHESWLAELFNLTNALQAVVIFIVFAIGFTTICAIAGAVKAQIAIHRDDVELLHLIGAQDHYIVKQFQRHAALLALKGSLLGLTSALIILGSVALLLQDNLQHFLPDMRLELSHITQLSLIPLVICTISALSARYSVLHVLQKMP